MRDSGPSYALFLFPTVMVIIGVLESADILLPLFLWWYACLICGSANLLIGFSRATSDERNRAQWVVAGFCLAVGCWMVSLASGLLAMGCSMTEWLCSGFRAAASLNLLAAPLLVICLWIALFYKGEVDSGRVVNRSIVYGLLIIILIMAFGVMEHVLSGLLAVVLPHGGSESIAVAACAGVVHPLKRMCEHAAEYMTEYLNDVIRQLAKR
jgi:hypothetical protein